MYFWYYFIILLVSFSLLSIIPLLLFVLWFLTSVSPPVPLSSFLPHLFPVLHAFFLLNCTKLKLFHLWRKWLDCCEVHYDWKIHHTLLSWIYEAFNTVKDQISAPTFLETQTGRHPVLWRRLYHFPEHIHIMGCLHSKVNDVSAHQSHKLSLLKMKCSEIIHSTTAFSVETFAQETFIQVLYFFTLFCLPYSMFLLKKRLSWVQDEP